MCNKIEYIVLRKKLNLKKKNVTGFFRPDDTWLWVNIVLRMCTDTRLFQAKDHEDIQQRKVFHAPSVRQKRK